MEWKIGSGLFNVANWFHQQGLGRSLFLSLLVKVVVLHGLDSGRSDQVCLMSPTGFISKVLVDLSLLVKVVVVLGLDGE